MSQWGNPLQTLLGPLRGRTVKPDALQARGPIQHANTAPPGAQADPDGPDASDVHFPEGGRPTLAQRPTPIVHLPREATQVGDAPPHLAFQVLVPDVAPEVVQFEVRLPITAQDALELVTAARDEHYSSRYPDLCPVFPQPDSAFAVLLARPAWAVTVRLACVDARAIDGRLYCMVVPERLRRESLLLWAKVPDSDDLLVAVADQLVPRQGFAHLSRRHHCPFPAWAAPTAGTDPYIHATSCGGMASATGNLYRYTRRPLSCVE